MTEVVGFKEKLLLYMELSRTAQLLRKLSNNTRTIVEARNELNKISSKQSQVSYNCVFGYTFSIV